MNRDRFSRFHANNQNPYGFSPPFANSDNNPRNFSPRPRTPRYSPIQNGGYHHSSRGQRFSSPNAYFSPSTNSSLASTPFNSPDSSNQSAYSPSLRNNSADFIPLDSTPVPNRHAPDNRSWNNESTSCFSRTGFSGSKGNRMSTPKPFGFKSYIGGNQRQSAQQKDISAYVDDSMLEDPWEKLEKILQIQDKV
ncbi:hypothetical protein GQR58_003628 [Nymphon striatum]|nr:hypothetical protein GQR58_003628 [Nymphon striatum]